jgi:WD domain, G-beta repeat
MPVVVDRENPWPGLASFNESAERFFHGRADEQAALRRLVTQAPLTVMFGASGLGKTSLLQAGLFPMLRLEHYLPVYVRLDLADESGPLVDQLALALWREVKQWRVDAPAATFGESTWEYLHREALELWSRDNRLLTPVFVLDQFEEIFTLGGARPVERDRLIVDLADLIENRIPEHVSRGRMASDTASGLAVDSQRYKIVLSFREDFLPQVEGLRRHVPSILQNRLRLLPMTGQQAFDAVHGSAGHLLDEPIAWRIVAFVSKSPDASPDALADVTVEPAFLSLVCRELNERRKRDKKAKFDEAGVSSTGPEIVDDFYDRALKDIPRHVRRFIQQELITERGFRKPCDVDDARRVHKVSDAHLRTLVDRRLVRIEPVRGTERVELMHDLLTTVVREHRNRDRRHTERRRTWFVVAASALIALTGLGFGLWAYGVKERAEAATVKAMAATFEANRQKVLADTRAAEAANERRNAEQSLNTANEATRKFEEAAKIADDSRRAAELSAGAEVAAAAQARRDRATAEALKVTADSAAEDAKRATAAAEKRRLEAVGAKLEADINARAATTARDRADRQSKLSVAQQLAARARVLQRAEDLPLAGQMAVHAYLTHREACRPDLDGAKTCTTDPFDANILPALQTVLNRLTRQHAAGAPGAGGIITTEAGGSRLQAVVRDTTTLLFSARVGDAVYRVTLPGRWREPPALASAGSSAHARVESLARLDRRVTAVALSTAGEPVAVGSLDGSVSLVAPPSPRRPAGPSPVVALAHDSRGSTVVVATQDGRLERRSAADGSAPAMNGFPSTTIAAGGTPPAVRTIAVPPGDEMALIGTSGGLYVWRFNGAASVVQGTDSLDVRSVAFSSDRRIAIGDRLGTVRVGALPNGPFTTFGERHASAVNALAFSPNGRLLATAGADGTVRVYPTAGDQSPVVFTEHAGVVESVVFPDDGVVVSGGADRTLRQWSTRMDHLVSSLCRIVCRDCPHPLQPPQEAALASALGGAFEDGCAKIDVARGGAGDVRVR